MKRTEQVNSIATQSITPRRKRRASKKKSATLTRADVNLIVNRNLHKLWKRNSLMQHLLLALELQQGNSQALMDGLKIYLI